MGKVLEDAGMLEKNPDGSLKVSDATAKKFLDVRNNLIDTGESGLPFPCANVDNKKNTAIKIYWEDKQTYPKFFKKWIDGILLNQLTTLNVEGNISSPIYDPLALGEKLGLDGLPNVPFPILLSTLALPPGTITPLLTFNLEMPETIEVFGKIPSVIVPPVPPIPLLPIPIDPEFPDMDHTLDPKFGVYGKMFSLTEKIPDMFTGMIGSIATPEFLASFATDGPGALFEKACEASSNSLPPPPADDLGSYNINMSAVSTIRSEALSFSTLGSVIGSSGVGIIGFLAANQGHKEPPPPPTTTTTESGSTEVSSQSSSTGSNTTSTTTEDSTVVKEIVKTWNVIPSNKSSLEITDSKHKKVWGYAGDAIKRLNSNVNRKYDYSGLHRQVLIGIAGLESKFGNMAPPSSNNWGGITCPNPKKPPGLAKSCTVVGVDKNSASGAIVSYAIYDKPEDSFIDIIKSFSSKGGVNSDKYKINGLMPVEYLLSRGPADVDEPGTGDDRATFFRVFLCMRRPPIYYEGDYTTTKKLYPNVKAAGWSAAMQHPDKPDHSLQSFTEAVKKYTQGALSVLQTCLYVNNVKWAMPKGTFADALIWYNKKYGYLM